MSLKQQSIEAYDRVAAEFAGDPLTSGIGRRLVGFAGPRIGEHVLDVGCGRGAVLFPAADAVGPAGRAVGVDLAPAMVRCTAAEIAERGWHHVTVRLDEGERPEFPPGSFDVVLSSLVMHLMDDPLGALRRYRRLLRPGGRFGCAEFAGGDDRWTPAMAALMEFVDPAAMPAAAGIPESALIMLSAPALCAALLDTGFVAPAVHEYTHEVRFDTVDQWWRWTDTHALSAFVRLIPAERLGAARAAVSVALDDLREPDGQLVYRLPVRLCRAIRTGDGP